MHKAMDIGRAHWHNTLQDNVHSSILKRARFKGGGTTVVQQPAAPEYTMTEEEKMLLKSEAEYYQAMQPMLSQYSQEMMPLEMERSKQYLEQVAPIEQRLLGLESQAMEAYMPEYLKMIEESMPLERERLAQTMKFTGGVLEGGGLPGEYGELGTAIDIPELGGPAGVNIPGMEKTTPFDVPAFDVPGIDTGVQFDAVRGAEDILQNEAFRKGSESVEARMNKLGILTSGGTGELERQLAESISIDRAGKEREDLWRKYGYDIAEQTEQRGLQLGEQQQARGLGLGERQQARGIDVGREDELRRMQAAEATRVSEGEFGLAQQTRGLQVAEQERKRSEMANMINLSMGVPMTILPSGRQDINTVAGLTQATPNTGMAMANQGVSNAANMIQAQNAQLQNYQLQGRPTYGYAPAQSSPLGDMAGQIGGTVGGIGMSKFMFGIPCFTGDTDVETVYGIVAIKDIQVGEEVKTDDGYKKVLDVKVHDDSANIAINGTMCTTKHPFVLADGTLKTANDLKIGDKLANDKAVWSRHVMLPKTCKVYNLVVEGHKYIVGNGLLVHDGMEVQNA